MADEAQIINGSFLGIPIAITSSSIDGGPKIVAKQFPNRDTQNVEVLGKKPRKYVLEISISDKQNQDYFSYRNELLAALDSGTEGELIHPLYGRIDGIIATTYSINETLSSFGDTVISAGFELNNNTGIPQTSGNVVTQVETLNTAVRQAVSSDIFDNFKVSEKFSGNFTSAAGKVNGIIDQAKDATAFIGEAAQTLNEFSAEIGRLSENVNSLVSDPLSLAMGITGLFESANGLYASARATFETFVGFFGFGDDDTDILQNTAGRIERDQNNRTLNGAVAASSLGYAYLSAVQVDYSTTAEIDALTGRLDDQYDAIMSSGSSQDVKDAVTDMRIVVLESLDGVRIRTPRVITVETLPTTVRLLGFNYYGDDTQGAALAELNGISDVSFIEGPIQVVTR